MIGGKKIPPQRQQRHATQRGGQSAAVFFQWKSLDPAAGKYGPIAEKRRRPGHEVGLLEKHGRGLPQSVQPADLPHAPHLVGRAHFQTAHQRRPKALAAVQKRQRPFSGPHARIAQCPAQTAAHHPPEAGLCRLVPVQQQPHDQRHSQRRNGIGQKIKVAGRHSRQQEEHILCHRRFHPLRFPEQHGHGGKRHQQRGRKLQRQPRHAGRNAQ